MSSIDELRDGDGQIDARRLTDPAYQPTTRVRAAECAFWRRRLASGAVIRDLDGYARWQRSHATVRRHAKGDCDCDHDVPAVAPTDGGHGGGAVWEVDR